MTDHAGATAHVAFSYGAAARRVECRKGVRGFHMKSVNVVQKSVIGFRHHRQRPRILAAEAALDAPGNHRVTHCPHAVRVGDHHRAFQKSGFFHPGGACHFAITIFGEPSGEDRVLRTASAGQYGSDSRADRSLPDDQLAFAGDQSAMADFHARHVGDGV